MNFETRHMIGGGAKGVCRMYRLKRYLVVCNSGYFVGYRVEAGYSLSLLGFEELALRTGDF